MKTISLISGPLGSGKSTVSKKLTETINECVLIEGDVLFAALENIEKVTWEQRLKITWKNILAITRNYLNANLNVVIDFVVEEELEWFTKELSSLNIEIKYIVLTTNKDTLAKRLEKRGEFHLLTRSYTLLDKLSKKSFNQQFFLDTTNKEITDLVQEIISTDRFKL